MKTFIKMLVCIILVSCIPITQVFAESSISVKIDGKEVIFTDAAPFVDANNRTQVPLRAIAEALGCEVEWNGSQQKAIVKRDYTDANALKIWRTYDEGEYLTLYEYKRVLELTIGSNMRILNVENSIYGQKNLYSGGYSEQKMDTSPIVKDNRTYLPVRYLAESFGYEVGWNAETQTVNLTSTNSIVGTYVSDKVSSFSNLCAIGLYETDYTALNRDFVSVEKAVIEFKDGRTIDVTNSIIDATGELKETFVDFGWDISVAYAGKFEYDFSPEENEIFRIKIKVNIADKDGNIGYQTYVFYFDITDGEGGYL